MSAGKVLEDNSSSLKDRKQAREFIYKETNENNLLEIMDDWNRTAASADYLMKEAGEDSDYGLFVQDLHYIRHSLACYLLYIAYKNEELFQLAERIYSEIQSWLDARK